MSQTTITTWAEKIPPGEHFVMASYDVMEPLRLFQACRRGCCADAGFGPQVLPRYWRDATPQEIADCWWMKRPSRPQPRSRHQKGRVVVPGTTEEREEAPTQSAGRDGARG